MNKNQLISLEDGLLAIKSHLNYYNQKNKKQLTKTSFILFNRHIYMNKIRMMAIASKSLNCSNKKCSVVANHFEMVPHNNGKTAHLELIGRNIFGKFIKLTCDHTIARGYGGNDSLNNITIMCSLCNSFKSKKEARGIQLMRNDGIIQCRPHSHKETYRWRKHLINFSLKKNIPLESINVFLETQIKEQQLSFICNEAAKQTAQSLGLSIDAFCLFIKKMSLQNNNQGILKDAKKTALKIDFLARSKKMSYFSFLSEIEKKGAQWWRSKKHNPKTTRRQKIADLLNTTCEALSYLRHIESERYKQKIKD